MAELVMWNLITLDGYFEGPKSWSLEWHQQRAVDEDFLRFVLDQLQTADMLLFGRVTYEGMAAYWRTADGPIAELMNALPKAVVSRTLANADWPNTHLIRSEPEKFVAAAKQKTGRNIFVFGSANLSATLMQHNLFDEYRFGLTALVLGRGNPLFPAGTAQTRLDLIEARPVSAGCLLLRYRPGRG